MPAQLIPIGTVTALTGTVTATNEEGTVRTLNQGDSIHQDDVIITKSDSKVELGFEDGTIFSQGENSEILLDVYVYDPATGSAELLFNLAEGSLRAVSGDIVKMNPEGFNVETPLSTVGIRGTTFFVLLTPEGQIAGVEAMDPSHVVVVTSDVGETIMTTHGQYVAVQLDGFISDPTLFSPEFLNEIRELTPILREELDQPGLPEQSQGDDPDGLQDDLEVQELLGLAEQLLQGYGNDPGSLHGQHFKFLPPSEIGNSLHDIITTLKDLLDQLQVQTPMQRIGDTADDILANQEIPELQTSLDLENLDADSDGIIYSAQLVAMGHNAISGTAGNDVNGPSVDLTGTAAQDAIFGLNGNDTMHGTADNDILFGGNGVDTMDGGDGDDFLYGGIGTDSLIGDNGHDYLVGGSGNDTFRFTASGNSNSDTIKDFSGTDRIEVSGTAFANLGGSTVNPYAMDNYDGGGGGYQLECLVYDSAQGKLYYDANGTMNAGGHTLIVQFETIPATIASVDIV